MDRITIEVADDGRVAVSAELAGAEAEALDFDSVAEAIDAVSQMLETEEREPAAEEMGETPAQEAAENPEAMWAEEAAKRPKQPGLMS